MFFNEVVKDNRVGVLVFLQQRLQRIELVRRQPARAGLGVDEARRHLGQLLRDDSGVLRHSILVRKL